MAPMSKTVYILKKSIFEKVMRDIHFNKHEIKWKVMRPISSDS